MKFEHTFVCQDKDGKYYNAKLENHDVVEACEAMENHKIDTKGEGFTNYWVVAAHKAL